MARRLNLSVGRKQFRGGYSGGSEQALRQQFNSSLNEVLNNYRQVINAIDGASAEIVEEVLAPTFEKSQVYCPVKSGVLKDSGYIEARQLSRGAECEIGYGRGGHPDYAIFVHEMPFHHEEPTRDKFLEAAVNEDYSTFATRLADKVREVVGA